MITVIDSIHRKCCFKFLKDFVEANCRTSFFDAKTLKKVTKHVKKARPLIVSEKGDFFLHLSNCFNLSELVSEQKSVTEFQMLDSLLNEIDQEIKVARLPRVH